MKRLFKLFVIGIVMLTGASVNAQTLKFGHINMQELFASMPERDSAMVTMQKLQKTYTDQLELLQVEYQNKLNDYQTNNAKYTDLIRKTKEDELQNLINRIQEFRGSAQQDIQQKEGELMQPIMNKAMEAVKKVGKANGFVYVFDISNGTVMYYSEQSTDVLPLVKAELKIKK